MSRTRLRATGMFCEDQKTMDAMLEYAIQEGFMSKCDDDHYHFSDNLTSIDQVIMKAKEEGLLVFYENDGTCYKLTQKGEDWFAIQNRQNVKENEK